MQILVGRTLLQCALELMVFLLILLIVSLVEPSPLSEWCDENQFPHLHEILQQLDFTYPQDIASLSQTDLETLCTKLEFPSLGKKGKFMKAVLALKSVGGTIPADSEERQYIERLGERLNNLEVFLGEYQLSIKMMKERYSQCKSEIEDQFLQAHNKLDTIKNITLQKLDTESEKILNKLQTLVNTIQQDSQLCTEAESSCQSTLMISQFSHLTERREAIKKIVTEILGRTSMTLQSKPNLEVKFPHQVFHLDPLNNETVVQIFSSLPGEGSFKWTQNCHPELTVSEDGVVVKRTIGSDHTKAGIIGDRGWSEGIHKWTLEFFTIENVLNQKDNYYEETMKYRTKATQNDYIDWVVFGVATENAKLNTHHEPSQTFGTCTRQGNNNYFSLGKNSGTEKGVLDGERIELKLDCENGLLDFLSDGQIYLQLNVPKKTKLYPWVHLYQQGNTVKIVKNI